MSWSVSATGKIEEVKENLKKQFAYPLAEAPAGLADEGEKETVRQAAAMIEQCLGTFDPERKVIVSAYGHMGFSNWETKAGAYQNLTISIGNMA
jgi:hypothetical protein